MERLGCEEEGSVRCSLFEGSCIVGCDDVGSTDESYWPLEKEAGGKDDFAFGDEILERKDDVSWRKGKGFWGVEISTLRISISEYKNHIPK